MDQISIPRVSREIMIKQALDELPNECCGLLLGRKGKVQRTLPMKNTDPSPDTYFMDPIQQVDVFTEMEKRGEMLIGIYHSHPKGPPTPSGADLKMAFHPDAAYIIISLENMNEPVVKAFTLQKGDYKELKLI